jgi:HEAT repeat protein
MIDLTMKRPTATPKTSRRRFRLMVWLGVVLLALILGADVLYAETPEERAWGMLRNGVNDSNTAKRTQAVFALRLLTIDPEATELAEAALKDRKPEVRAAAATALGSIGSSEAIPALKKVLNDKKPAVAIAAAHSLLILNDPAGYDVYYELLIGERKASDGVGAQEAATFKGWKNIAELALSQGLAFFPGGSVAFSAVMALREDDSSPVRATAATALADDMDPRIGRALVQATLDKNWTIRASAVLAIAERGDPELRDAIVPALSDKNQVVRVTAAAAEIRLSKAAVPEGESKLTNNSTAYSYSTNTSH